MVGELGAAMGVSKMLVVSASRDEAELSVEEDVDSEGTGALGL